MGGEVNQGVLQMLYLYSKFQQEQKWTNSPRVASLPTVATTTNVDAHHCDRPVISLWLIALAVALGAIVTPFKTLSVPIFIVAAILADLRHDIFIYSFPDLKLGGLILS